MHEVEFVALDCETTGLDPQRDSIIELGAVKFTLLKNLENFDSLFSSPVRIPSFVERLTGIHNEDLATAPHFTEKKAEFVEFCQNAILLGHNLNFDLDFLLSHGVDLRSAPQLDTHLLAGLVLPRSLGLSLENLAEHFAVVHTDAHRALSDAEATRDLFRVLLVKAQEFSQESWKRIAELKISPAHWLKQFAELAQAASELKGFKFREANSVIEKISSNRALEEKLRDWTEHPQTELLETDASAGEIMQALQPSEKKAVVFLKNNYAARTLSSGDLPLLLAPREYLCQRKLDKVIQQELSSSQALLVAKLLLHPEKNNTELNLSRAETLLFSSFAADQTCLEQHSDCQFQRAYAQAQGAPLVLSDQASLSALAKLLSERTFIIAGSETLVENLKRAKSLTLDLPTLEQLIPDQSQAVAMWWGLLGLLFREAAPQWGRLDLAEAEGQKNYSTMREAGRNLLAAAANVLPPRVQKALDRFLSDEPGYVRLVYSNALNEITVALRPRRVEVPQLTPTLFVGSALDAGDACAFTLRQLALPAETICTKLLLEKTPAQIVVAEGLPNPASPEFNKVVTRTLIQVLTKSTGFVAVVFANQRDAGDCYEKIADAISQPIFTRRFPGPDKLSGMKSGVFFTTIFSEQSLPPVEQMILVKIPFVMDGDGDWEKQTLPASALKFKQIWADFAAQPCAQEFIVLDPRLLEKGYGRSFLEALGQKFEQRGFNLH